MMVDHFFDRKAKMTPVIDKMLNTKRNCQDVSYSHE